ncbi:MAG: Flp family type IVb pilin [Chloroflexi bacterium]|nr:Flp family type IVb pilin [Chloroflexota bacterium]
MNSIRDFVVEDEGQDVVEYGLLVATIGLVVLVGTIAFGNNIETWFSALATRVTTN